MARSDGLVSYRKIVTVGVSLDAAWYSGGGLFVLVNGGLVVVVEWVAALAAAGGSALVGAAATDAWQGARDGVRGASSNGTVDGVSWRREAHPTPLTVPGQVGRDVVLTCGRDPPRLSSAGDGWGAWAVEY